MERLRSLCYKLRMICIPIEGPTYMYEENMSVIYNTSQPDSTLKKKSNSACYHSMFKAVDIGELLTTHFRSKNNPSDIFTKVIPGGTKQYNFTLQVLYNTP